jgi:energy-coupling factor transport system ATP-binding protein
VGGRTLASDTRLSRLLSDEVGIVFQFPEKQLFAETVTEDVAAGPAFAQCDAALIPGRVRAALERVGLDPDEYGGRSPFALTWGEKRLVAIAGVLVLDTPCLVFDEPGAGLDPLGRRRVGALLRELAHRERKTVVVVSHHLADLFSVADRVALLHEGRIAFCGTAAELLASAELQRSGLCPPPPAILQTPPLRS